MANIISDETIEYVGILAKLELSEEEKEQARQDAIERLRQEEMAKMRKHSQPKPTTEKKTQDVQPSLFDF